MTESALKSTLCRKMRERMRGFKIMRHEDTVQRGLADISVTGCGWTSWWEVKHGTPGFDRNRSQFAAMQDLARAGYARYIIYREDDQQKETFIVQPDALVNAGTGTSRDHRLTAPIHYDGFDHVAVAKYIYGVHARWAHLPPEPL